MSWFHSKPENAVVVLPPERQTQILDINANSHVMQGIGQQIASIAPN
ncbi:MULTISPECIES: hypothetical protein [unclassified Bradyrhizobium]|nr:MULTISPECIES: hypothetical protein [unclassified Bradyrhizobium]